jgi:regulator of cell morphogenesis and NO signaling
MNVRAEKPVSELVESLPRAATVFEVVQINTCCKRDRTLAEGCSAAGIDLDELLALLDEVPLGSRMDRPAFPPSAPLLDVTAFITDYYHRRARKYLVDLTLAVRSLCGGHGQTAPELWALRKAIEELARDLVPHMYREERYLFPYMHALDGGRMEREIVVPLFGTVEYPLQFIRHDHAHDLEGIARIRALTSAVAPAGEPCGQSGALYAALLQFASELEEHIELENDVLFPRAIEAEKRIFDRTK